MPYGTGTYGREVGRPKKSKSKNAKMAKKVGKMQRDMKMKKQLKKLPMRKKK